MPGYQEILGEGLVLRTVRDERDAEAYASFIGTVTQPVATPTCALMLRHHPHMTYDDYLLVEDERTHEVVSTTCLIPRQCRYEDIVLDVAQLEAVGTHRAYRGRGLIRAQIRRFHEMVSERGFDLSIIEGIPYYYRQYGYGYCLDLRAFDWLPAWRIPDGPADASCPCDLRPAIVDDVPSLARLYRQAMAGVQIHALRDEAEWRYAIQWLRYPVRMIVDRRHGEVVGYICTSKVGHGGRDTKVIESAITNYDVAMATLRVLKQETEGEIKLDWPQLATLVQVGRSLGSVPYPAYQWLLRITDAGRLLAKIGPALERRVAASAFAGLTADICLNLYREGFILHFRSGKLSVEAAGFVDASMGADGGDIRIPPEAFPRLVFGYRSLQELRDVWPDAGVKPEFRHLVDVLFPRMTSYLCLTFLYCGPLAESAHPL